MKEAYCSYEIAKLLKEKGFEQHSCAHSYDSNGVFKWSDDLDPYEYSAPTHQMAMKWLREECEVYIDIETCYEYTNRNENFKVTGFAFTIHTKDDPCYDDDNSFDSYEEACETAIKHVLENLI